MAYSGKIAQYIFSVDVLYDRTHIILFRWNYVQEKILVGIVECDALIHVNIVYMII